MKSKESGERGTAIVLVALALTGLLGMVALVADFGQYYLWENRLQTMADAAALAGVQELPDHPEAAVSVAEQYLTANGGTGLAAKEVTVATDNKSMTVKLSQDVSFAFAPILGVQKGRVSVQASARVAPVKAMKGLAPLAVKQQNFVFGQEYVLKNAAGAGDNGWYGAMALGGHGASTYEDNLKYGYQGVIAIGDILETEPGNMSGPTRRGIQYRLGTMTDTSTPDNIDPNSPRLLYVPVIDDIPKNGRSTARVVGFAAFLLKNELPGNGNDCQIKGYFVRVIVPAEQLDDTSAGFGLYGTRLSE
ncbi:MAG: pilus assembly protein TadG-related protein [Bacillota bacterium]